MSRLWFRIVEIPDFGHSIFSRDLDLDVAGVQNPLDPASGDSTGNNG
jgi:hypothetical protein